MPSPRLLVVDDEPDLRTLYELTLLREGYDVESAGGVEEAWSLLQARGPGGYQLVITDTEYALFDVRDGVEAICFPLPLATTATKRTLPFWQVHGARILSLIHI